MEISKLLERTRRKSFSHCLINQPTGGLYREGSVLRRYGNDDRSDKADRET